MTDREKTQALERLMAEYGDQVKRFCALQLRDAFQAEDAAQDAFVKAWKALDTFRNESSEKTWLMRIALNTCRDYQRTGWYRHTERRFTPDDLPEQGQEASFPDGEVTRAVSSLPDRLREAVLLRYYQELPLRDTAVALHTSLASAKRRIKKANEILRRELKGWFEDE